MHTCTCAGEALPVVPGRIDAVEERDSSVLIQWTIRSITYTPETYMVQYGTSPGNLNLTSDVIMSGNDITVVDKTYMITLMGLQPVTMYYYRVMVNNSFGSIVSLIGNFITLARGNTHCSVCIHFT